MTHMKYQKHKKLEEIDINLDLKRAQRLSKMSIHNKYGNSIGECNPTNLIPLSFFFSLL